MDQTIECPQGFSDGDPRIRKVLLIQIDIVSVEASKASVECAPNVVRTRTTIFLTYFAPELRCQRDFAAVRPKGTAE